MRAFVLHGPGAFDVQADWPEPQVRPGWARVRVSYAGICGSDLPRFISTGSYHHPMILGHEFTGVVETPAPDSTRYRGGERVAVLPIIPCGHCPGCEEHEPFHCEHYQFLGSRNDGGFAEYCLVPESNLFLLPDGLDARVGAFMEPLAVGLHVVRRSGLAAGSRVLIYGAGPIGLLVGLWAQVFGAERVVMADLRAESLALARKLGLEAVDPSEVDLASLGAMDVTIEAAGARAALLGAIVYTRHKGTITVVGRDTGDTLIPHQAFEQLMRKELSLQGCWGYNMHGEEPFVREMLRQGRFPLVDLVTQQVPLEQAPAMVRAMAARQLFYCKVLLEI